MGGHDQSDLLFRDRSRDVAVVAAFGANRRKLVYPVLVYKALNGLSPQNLADDCQLITTTGRRRLRSSNVATCDVPQTRTTLGDRSSTATGPRLSNNLQLHLRDSELSLLEFRRLLKTHLFGCGLWRLVTYFRCSALYKCTYLLTYLLTNPTFILCTDLPQRMGGSQRGGARQHRQRSLYIR